MLTYTIRRRGSLCHGRCRLPDLSSNVEDRHEKRFVGEEWHYGIDWLRVLVGECTERWLQKGSVFSVQCVYIG